MIHGLVLVLLAQIDWKKDWDAVSKAASESKKPIFWLHLVGELEGNT
jgi:hypothetical protein